MLPVDAIISLGFLILLAWIVYGPWQALCTDFARQHLFEARDKVFDLAHAGKLNFSSDEYRVIRAALEKSIRFAHEMTLPRFVILWVAMKRAGLLSNQSALRVAITAIDDKETRDTVSALVNEAYRSLVAWMVIKSPATMFVATFIIAPLLGIHSLRGRRNERFASEIGDVFQKEVEASPEAFVAQAS